MISTMSFAEEPIMTDETKVEHHPNTLKRAALGSLGAKRRIEMDEAEAARAQAALQEKE